MADPIFYMKATYILGWTNILFLLLVIISCRCLLNNWGLSRLNKSNIFMKIYKHHCIYWYFLIISVLLHGIFAITGFGNPF